MLKQCKHYAFITLFFILLLGIMTVPCAAADGLGFNTAMEEPDNQVSDKGYFDLQITPGQKQDLVVHLTNIVDEDLTIAVEVKNAYTASDGYIGYQEAGQEDETLKHPFASFATPDQTELVLPKGETKKITITMNTPQEAFDGKIIGALIFKQLPDEEEAAEDAEGQAGTRIINVYQFALPVVLQQNDNAVPPKFELAGIEPKMLNERAGVQVDLRNAVPLLVKGASVSTELYQLGEAEPLFTQAQESFEMAPNSVWAIKFVDNAGYGFPAGDYNLKMKVQYEGQTWDFDENFTIEQKQTDEMNANAVNQNQQNAPRQQQGGGLKLKLPTWAIIAIAVGGLIVLLIIIVLLRIRKSNKEYERYVAERMKQMQEKANEE